MLVLFVKVSKLQSTNVFFISNNQFNKSANLTSLSSNSVFRFFMALFTTLGIEKLAPPKLKIDSMFGNRSIQHLVVDLHFNNSVPVLVQEVKGHVSADNVARHARKDGLGVLGPDPGVGGDGHVEVPESRQWKGQEDVLIDFKSLTCSVSRPRWSRIRLTRWTTFPRPHCSSRTSSKQSPTLPHHHSG